MTVCLCGRGADLDKVNKYLSFSPFDIILISEYVDDMKLPDCECYYIAKSEIKNTKSIILQISRKRHLQYTSVVLCKDILLDSKLSKIIFKCSVKNITFVLNINRMFDLHYLDDCRKNISTKLIRLSKCSREENYPNTIGYLRFYRVFFIWMMMCLVRNYPAIRVVQK